MVATDPWVERRKEAQLAMEDPAHAEARTKKTEDLVKQRQLARQAMEGEERRHRRELKEKLEREKRLQLDRQKSAADAAVAVKQNAERAAAAAKEAAVKQQTAAREQQIESITASEELIEKLKVKELNLSPIRTYKTDMARAVKEEGVSISKIALSEQNRNRLAATAGQPAKHGNRIWLWLILLVAVAVLGGVIYLKLFYRSTPTVSPVVPTNSTPPTAFFFTETTKDLALQADPEANLKALTEKATQTTQQGIKSIEAIYFTEGNNTLSWSASRQLLGLQLPDELNRSLVDQYMFGIYQTGSSSSRFLILKDRDYSLAYAGLLDWEDRMADSLLPLLAGRNANQTERLASFSDRLIRNKDARQLKVGNNPILFYVFLDPQTILLTQNEETFIEIFNRYTQSNTGPGGN